MRNLINVLLVFLLVISVGSVLGSPISVTGGQQNDQQNAASEQQTPPATQEPGSSNSAAQSVTGCVVQSEHGYSLETDNGTYPLETEKNLSQYVNKKIKITAILEHHKAAAPSETSGHPATVTEDLRLRRITTVIGDCNRPSK